MGQWGESGTAAPAPSPTQETTARYHCLPGTSPIGGGTDVLPRLRTADMRRNARPSWPEFDEDVATELYVARPQYRKLVVLVDSDVLPTPDQEDWSKQFLLAGLLRQHCIEFCKYADDGPPPDAPREWNEKLAKEIVPGWAVLGADDGTGHRNVTTGDKTWMAWYELPGNANELAALDTSTAAYGDLLVAEGEQRRRRDAEAVMVAEALGADVFVTSREYLFATSLELAEGVTIARVDEALSILGLYLRTQGLYVPVATPDGVGSVRVNRGLFFWVGTVDALPSAWRWLVGCADVANRINDDSPLILGQSVLQRVQRALQARDEVHLWLNAPQDNDTADRALSALDVVLLLLMGAVDATAQIVHRDLELKGHPWEAKWQKAGWLKNVAISAPSLSALFSRGSEDFHTLRVLRLLRNCVHGEALQQLAVVSGPKRERTLVAVPEADLQELETSFEASGGRVAWGVEELLPGRLHFDPGVFVEQLFPRVLTMLDHIMANSQTAEVEYASSQTADGASTDGQLDPGTFSPQNRDGIRWQLGL